MNSSPHKTTGLALWKWLLLPLMAAMSVMAYLWAQDAAGFSSPGTARIIFWHVPMAILSMVWFFAAAFYSTRYLAKRSPFDDTRASLSAEVGLVLTVLATVTGAIFSKMQWAGGANSPWYEGYWQWDPKQTAIVIVMVFYGAYFALRMSVEDTGARAKLSSVYALLGAVVVPFAYYVLPRLPGSSLHPDLIVVKREGMDAAYRATFLFSTLLHLGVSLWAYHLKLRLIRLEEHEQVAEVAPGRTAAVRRAAEPETEGAV